MGLWGYCVSVAAPVATDDSVRYLSDLTPVHHRQGWGTLNYDRSVNGGVIRLDDTLHLKGLGTHAPATLTYAVPKGFHTLEAVVGVSGYISSHGSVVVSVSVDGNTVFTSDTLTASGDPVAVAVPVLGATLVTLHVDATPDGNKCDHVDWAGAKFTKTPDEP